MQNAQENGPDSDQWMTEREVAAWLHIGRTTLLTWRQRGEGPAYHKFTRSTTRYRRFDVLQWLEATRQG